MSNPAAVSAGWLFRKPSRRCVEYNSYAAVVNRKKKKASTIPLVDELLKTPGSFPLIFSLYSIKTDASGSKDHIKARRESSWELPVLYITRGMANFPAVFKEVACYETE